ncbi:Gfo/Idh/MocA family protein [Oleiharenicola lentus]|uniref:Gfo/Idh/MocA family protein n=1 Tax=Oleiharenicola lentus TaxID=2508720 RepID=UPI003F675BAB
MASKKWRIAGINFDFRHMDHLLAYAHQARNAEIVGISHHDPKEMQHVITHCAIPPERVFTDWRACLEQTKPDVVILCPASGAHAEWVEKVAPFGVHVLIEKPFAGNLAQADRMIAAMKKARRRLAINWPLAWYPCHVTAHRLLSQGVIGELQEIHFYDGNRSPIQDRSQPGLPSPTTAQKKASWFYDSNGGGSLVDYLGYGVTLGTWFFNGRKPTEISTLTATGKGLPVDEQSMTIARYGDWLSTFHTRWGTFTDPWENQPQPKCGFVLKGSEGTIANYDYEPTIRLQTRKHPEGKVVAVDKLKKPHLNPVHYFLHCLETGAPIEGPISVETSRIGQQIVDTAARSAKLRKPLKLIS